jgi:stringent starvation protein B
MKPRRPYLLRAMHEWISDSGCTPHVVVDATFAGVEVPQQYVKDGKIVLNISWSATAQLVLGNDEISFNGRFGGASMSVSIPVEAVLAVYARETGQGMVFAEETPTPGGEPPSGPGGSSGSQGGDAKPGTARPKLTVVK